jgi:hypothetical protein
MLRDEYGTRFGIIAGFRYPEGEEHSVLLMDFDVCEFQELVGCAVYGDAGRAAAAWREAAGDSAQVAQPTEVTVDGLNALVYFQRDEAMILGHESRNHMDAWFRGPRRLSDLLDVLTKQGLELPKQRSLYHGIDPEPMATEFSAWYAERHGQAPDAEIAEAVAYDWLEGTLPGTEYAVSPRRMVHKRRMMMGEWLPGEERDAGFALLQEWVRWLGERGGLSAHLLDRAVQAVVA